MESHIATTMRGQYDILVVEWVSSASSTWQWETRKEALSDSDEETGINWPLLLRAHVSTSSRGREYANEARVFRLESEKRRR